MCGKKNSIQQEQTSCMIWNYKLWKWDIKNKNLSFNITCIIKQSFCGIQIFLFSRSLEQTVNIIKNIILLLNVNIQYYVNVGNMPKI